MSDDHANQSRGDRETTAKLIREYREGRREALDELMPRIERELRRLAHRLMSRQPANHTLQTTALVNEAFLKFAQGEAKPCRTQEHLIAVLATAMRHVLVDHSRSKGRDRRRADGQRLPLDNLVACLESPSLDLISLDVALRALEELDPKLVHLVELRFFAGRTMAEIAEIMGRAQRSLERDWEFARRWLSQRLRDDFSPT